jgi:hypothetical protein
LFGWLFRGLFSWRTQNSYFESINKPNNRPNNQSTSQPTNKSTGQTTNQLYTSELPGKAHDLTGRQELSCFLWEQNIQCSVR